MEETKAGVALRCVQGQAGDFLPGLHQDVPSKRSGLPWPRVLPPPPGASAACPQDPKPLWAPALATCTATAPAGMFQDQMHSPAEAKGL